MSTTSPSSQLIRRRLAALARALPDTIRGSVEGVHQARVATRRLREALSLVTRGSRGERLRGRVRRLTLALGGVRELDVALQTLDEFEGAAPAGALACLRQAIGEERGRLRAELSRQVERVGLDEVRKEALSAARRHVARKPGSRASSRADLARTRAAARGAALRDAIEAAGSMYLPDRLHRVRLATKKLRYAMEIVRELSRSRATVRIHTLKEAQELLGRMHDLDVLVARVRALQGSDRAPSLKLSAELDELVRRIEIDARQLHVRYIGVRKKLLAICDHVAPAEA